MVHSSLCALVQASPIVRRSSLVQAMAHDELINNTVTAQHFRYLQRAAVRSAMHTVRPQRVDACLHNLCRVPGVPTELAPALRTGACHI